MSSLIDDLQNLANEADADERLVQAARIDACIDELVGAREGEDALRARLAELEGERDAAKGRADMYRDRLVEVYFKDAPQQEGQRQPENDKMSNVVKGAADLCGGWKKG